MAPALAKAGKITVEQAQKLLAAADDETLGKRKASELISHLTKLEEGK